MPRPLQLRASLRQASRTNNQRLNHYPLTSPTSRDLQVIEDLPRGTVDSFGQYYESSDTISKTFEGMKNQSPSADSDSGLVSKSKRGSRIGDELSENDEGSDAKKEQEYPSGGSEKEEEERDKGKRDETIRPRVKNPFKKPTPSAARPLELEDNDDNKNNNQFLLKRITLSEDRTSGSAYSQKQLLALTGSDRPAKNKQKDTILETENSDNSSGPYKYSTSDHVQQDYQMQLMLLEQQNKRRLMMAREEQDALDRARGVRPSSSMLPIASTPPSERTSGSSMPNPREIGDRGLADETTPHIQYEGHMSQYEQLMDRIRILEQENLVLRRFVDPDSTHWGPPFFQVLYRFKGNDRVFLRPPKWTRNTLSGKPRYTLKGDPLSMRADEYLKRSRALAFAIFKTYATESGDDPSKDQDQEADMWPAPEPDAETILFVSDCMREALDTYLNEQPNFKDLFPQFSSEKEIPAPYLFWYCCRSSHESILKRLSPRHKSLMELFAHWITSNYESEYMHVDDQLSRGVISSSSMKYLVKPGDVLVSSKKAHFQAYMAKSWAEQNTTLKQNNKGDIHIEVQKTWQVDAWSYDFDGSFYRKATNLTIQINVEDLTEEVALKDLCVIPMLYVDREIQLRLEQRGRTYWECRKKKFVSCRSSNDIESMTNNNERFMIDFPTYNQLHPSGGRITRTLDRGEGITPERMDVDEPPSAPDLFLFPSTIIGFNLRRKKWVDLEVDLIRKVEWNKQAFESLVVEEETKELVQALVTNRLEAERGTDMIDDKGNGLTILLHGGPGTGKTFTAESVAELAEKPLYRVTCGDIGTHPEEVEQYLESALHLGKIWGCVVLLDEADVFLQERTLSDLKRNALVAVFLRVLEYYDGILILTSNRVGTFDEAFKSRIQLSLHYPNLSKAQRLKVWRNLINRLKRLDQPSIDFDDVECYLAELAEENMNGREIRNAITTARQLAKFKGKKVSHAHLKHVINVAGRFEKYLSTVKEGFTDDDIARESGLR